MTEIEKLKKLVRGKNTAQKVVLRASIILKYKEDKKKLAIAKELNTSRPTIDLWIKRYEEQGINGLLKDAARPGRKPRIDAVKEKQIIEATLQTTPKGATHWSNRTMAEQQGVSKMTIQRIWKKYNLKPHLVKGFKVSKDKKFVEKVTDIVGL